MTASSAAIAAPLVMNIAANAASAQSAEKADATGKRSFFVNDDCVICMRCKTVCPVSAITYDGDKSAINDEKCIRCGACHKICKIGAIVDTGAEVPVHRPHPVVHRECDFLVVGGGTAGVVAAAIAAEISGKKVLVIEKGKKPGGSGYYAAGVRLFSTKWQLDAGVPDQMEDYIRSAMNITSWELNPKLVANSFRALPAFFDWFCTWGRPKEVFTMTESRYSKARKGIEVINKDGLRATPIIERVLERCQSQGVEILTEYTATEFIMGDHGEFLGVKAKDPGGTTFIKCKYGLISTGNVINCSPLMERCVPEYAHALVRRGAHRLPTNTGDGVLMAEKAGIPIEHDRVCVTYTTVNTVPIEPQLRGAESRGEALFINFAGKRFVNETFSAGNMNWVLLRQPKNAFYSIMDSKVLFSDALGQVTIVIESNMGGRNVESGVPDPLAKATATASGPGGAPGGGAPSGGAPGGAGGAASATAGPGGSGGAASAAGPGGPGGPGGGGMGMPMQTKPDAKELQRLASLAGRHVIIADTIEEMADKMGIDRKTLVETVKKYNEYCAKGHDDEFYKQSKYLLPVEHGPFYAFSYFLGMDGAVGGLGIDENMQVTGHDGPIKGLYAAGDTTGGRFVNHGGDRIEIINDMTWAVASGFLAGETIGKLLKG
jgi:succinate dehydrogenase/fumarate reductase flavoprotein subunit/Pyruvate/2-oxoacid:ferredoxin oxidoreductase delta subunit